MSKYILAALAVAVVAAGALSMSTKHAYAGACTGSPGSVFPITDAATCKKNGGTWG